jgi:hypothetical protein
MMTQRTLLVLAVWRMADIKILCRIAWKNLLPIAITNQAGD